MNTYEQISSKVIYNGKLRNDAYDTKWKIQIKKS